MRTKSLHLAGCLATLGAFAGTLAMAGDAFAAECSSLPKTVVVAGSTAVASFIQTVGKALANHTDELGNPDPITVIYAGQGSCVGVGYFAPPPGSTAPLLMAGGTIPPYGTTDTCDNTSGIAVDIGLSDVFPSSCNAVLPSRVTDFHGPVQTMAFAVYKDSSMQVMSAEAAFLTFGFNNGDGQTPWNDPTRLWVRSNTSGTQQMISHAIGVPAEAWVGQSQSGSGGVISGLQAVKTAAQDVKDSTLGILGMDAIRGNSAGDVIPLAYQHYGQTAGYLPSSSLSTNDMQNTRDGHYFIQGPLHMIAKVSSSGVPVNANAKLLIDYMTGAVVPTDFDLIQVEADKSVVPDCAMRVSRDEEDGPFMSYMPPISCECKFLAATGATLPDECSTCTGNDQCTDSARPHCNYGYCEVQ